MGLGGVFYPFPALVIIINNNVPCGNLVVYVSSGLCKCEEVDRVVSPALAVDAVFEDVPVFASLFLVLGDEDGDFGVFGLLDYPIGCAYGDFHGSGLVSIGPKGMGCLSIKGRWWAFLLVGLRR